MKQPAYSKARPTKKFVDKIITLLETKSYHQIAFCVMNYVFNDKHIAHRKKDIIGSFDKMDRLFEHHLSGKRSKEEIKALLTAFVNNQRMMISAGEFSII